MKKIWQLAVQTTAVAALSGCLAVSCAQADSVNKDNGTRGASPGATGAMQNSNSNGVATDPGGVAAQQGDTSKNSAGTVGAAPGGDTKSQDPNGKK